MKRFPRRKIWIKNKLVDAPDRPPPPERPILEGVDGGLRTPDRPHHKDFAEPHPDGIAIKASNGDELTLQPHGNGYVHLRPGTPEFTAKYIQPPEPEIHTFLPDGPEGFKVSVRDREGNETGVERRGSLSELMEGK